MNIGELIKGFAPMLATAVTGPVGGLVVSKIAEKLGVEDTVAAVAQAVQNPANREKLMELENAQMKLIMEDRDSARKREIALANSGASWLSKNIVAVLAFVIIIAWIGVQGYLLTHVIENSMMQLIARVLGMLDAALMMILSYFYGQSKKED